MIMQVLTGEVVQAHVVLHEPRMTGPHAPLLAEILKLLMQGLPAGQVVIRADRPAVYWLDVQEMRHGAAHVLFATDGAGPPQMTFEAAVLEIHDDLGGGPTP
jgi:hypothetical protein